jgi:hypothetical protein
MRCAATAVNVWMVVQRMLLPDRLSISPDRGVRYSLPKHVTTIYVNEKLCIGPVVYAFMYAHLDEINK